MSNNKTITQWFSEYGISHQNKVNRYIHKVCVPLILWASVTLIYCIPVPTQLNPNYFNWCYLSVIIALLFYLRLGVKPFVIMLFQFVIILCTIKLLNKWQIQILSLAIIVFIIAWVGQFIGHKIEGKKPSFFKDLQFLLIGPLWVLLKH